jgi:hypothetical protein
LRCDCFQSEQEYDELSLDQSLLPRLFDEHFLSQQAMYIDEQSNLISNFGELFRIERIILKNQDFRDEKAY